MRQRPLEVIGVRAVRIDTLQLPGDLRRRLATTNVEELVEDLARWTKFIHDPLVRESDLRIIAGRDRIAAAKQLGHTTIEVKLVECTDAEAEELELVENLKRRRDDEATLRREYLAIQERRALAEAEPEQPRSPGRPATARGKARRHLAEKVGVTKNAVEKMESRATAAEEPSWGADDRPAQPTAPVEMLGVDGDAEFFDAVREVQSLLDEADQHARQIQALLTRLHKVKLPPAEARWQRLQRAAHSLGVDLRGARPVSVCPWCKLVPRLRGACIACQFNGYVVEEQLPGVPEQLQRVDDDLVADGGRYVPRAQSAKAAPTWADQRGARAQRRLTVTMIDEDGQEHEVPADE